ncbi:adenosylcobinamide kinase/adenosylcobinamide-phosphate guanylyltransferase [Caldalkalibacillus uzonensis]|uniref:Adenosylcobinamide kinase n=1 Tax=Caldalkalibacillus uzonensis TaxID=353224 RepID=A0ABU0CPJ2_9BACI|nr:adenosylcobinamide kinase/adenosylcobinamide-phosphate guanylyltransferase [Caldalkalibacillus uzonensis]
MQLAKKGTPLVYVATAQPLDSEMAERIERHRRQRSGRWQTIEEAKEVDKVINLCQEGSIVLVDCLTIWLSHLLFEDVLSVEEILTAARRMLATAEKRQLSLVLVSNDVNEGVPPVDREVRRYIYALEQVHRLCVAEADQAVQVIAGQGVMWKGDRA